MVLTHNSTSMRTIMKDKKRLKKKNMKYIRWIDTKIHLRIIGKIWIWVFKETSIYWLKLKQKSCSTLIKKGSWRIKTSLLSMRISPYQALQCSMLPASRMEKQTSNISRNFVKTLEMKLILEFVRLYLIMKKMFKLQKYINRNSLSKTVFSSSRWTKKENFFLMSIILILE